MNLYFGRRTFKPTPLIPDMKRDLKAGEVLWRYSKDVEDGSQWHISVMDSRSPLHPTGTTTSYLSAVPGMAEWLERIINAALLGGHMTRPVWGTPHGIVWFITDEFGDLVEFI